VSAKPSGVASVAQARRAKPIERGTSSKIWSIVESHAHMFANGALDQSSKKGRRGPALLRITCPSTRLGEGRRYLGRM